MKLLSMPSIFRSCLAVGILVSACADCVSSSGRVGFNETQVPNSLNSGALSNQTIPKHEDVLYVDNGQNTGYKSPSVSNLSCDTLSNHAKLIAEDKTEGDSMA